MLPSQKEDRYSIVADFRNVHFFKRFIDKKINGYIEPLESLLIDGGKPFRIQYEKPTKDYTKTFLQQFASLKDTDITGRWQWRYHWQKNSTRW